MSLRTPASSRVRSMLARRRVALATMLVALGLLLASASYAEARGAPRWLTRWLRAVSGRSAIPAPTAAPGDTVVLFGPKTMALGSGTSATFVERFTVPGAPTSTMATSSSGYLLRTTNGPGGAGAITGGTITLNGAVVVTTAQLAALSAGASLDVPVQLAPADTIVAALTGPANAALSVSVLAAPDPTFLVFGPKQYERVNGAPITITERFTVPAGGIAPSYLCVRNGELDGTRRNSSATISLNGTEVVTPSDLNQQVAGFRKRVTYLPAGQENVLLVQLSGVPGSRLTLCAAATDAAPPRITVTAPVRGLITRQLEVDAVGVVDDQTAVTITVNGLPATVAAGTPGKTSFTAKTPLAVEGANTIVIRAVDAAGKTTDSTRTVIRDTEAPVVTLDALPDSVLYRRDSVLTITGTITDRTAVTANVNGTPLVVDSATKAFSQLVTLSQGTNFIAITATDAAGNATSVVRQITLDNVPPTLTLTAPAAGAITKVATTKVIGAAAAQSAVTVTVNGTAAPVGTNGAFSADVTLTEGSNTLTVVATNAAGVTATATRVVTLDTQAPVLTWTSPLEGTITKVSTIDVSGTVTDRSAVTVTLNGVALALTSIDPTTSGFLSGEPVLTDGAASFTLVATDAAGNEAILTRGITRDATPPIITLQSPIAGLSTAAASIQIVGSVSDLSTATLTVNGVAATLAPDGGFAVTVALSPGANLLTIIATDGAGNSSTSTRNVTRESISSVTLPPDPVTIAPALNRTVATTLSSSTAFLYTGASPIQTGVVAGTMTPYQVSVLRGRVTTRDGAALPGVTVSVLRHPEFGRTLSRADGRYDLVANGGEPLTVDFSKAGQLPAQRQIDVPRQRWVSVPEVALVDLDSAVTAVDLSAPAPVARGSVVSDASGSRRATLVFEQGTAATMVLPDGSSQPLTTLSVRATEFTVGPGGPRAMPASLPATSAYTYASELSVDEAIAAGATSVRFTKPVSVYVENFIAFPVGMVIPVATYDRVRARWVPESNGRVIKVLSTSGGIAQVDVRGTGLATQTDSLSALGFSDAELRRLAELYPAGQTLWRYRLTHFTPTDANLSPVVQAAMTPPLDPPKPDNGAPPGSEDDQAPSNKPKKPNCKKGSVIGCESRTLGERVPIAGTNLTLVYASQRTAGFRADYGFDVPLGEAIADSLLSQMTNILLRVSVAGKTTIDTFPARSGQRARVAWDGKDAYGRVVQGQARMVIEVAYVYRDIPYGAPVTSGPSFGQASGVPMTQTVRAPFEVWRTMMDRRVGTWSNAAAGLGGWSLSEHHAYDAAAGVLYRGSGGASNAGNLNPTLVGTKGIRRPSAIIANPDGSLLVLDTWTARIYKIARDGTQTVFAGTGTYQSSGDGGPAVNAGMNPWLMARGPDGTIYVADLSAQRIRQVDANGVITPFAGNGDCSGTSDAGDGGPALLAQVCTFGAMDVGPDGSVYVIAYRSNAPSGRVRRIGPDGIITHFAGTYTTECGYGGGGPCPENQPAISSNLGFPRYLSVQRDGTVLIVDIKNSMVLKVSTSGLLTRFAGKGIINYSSTMDGDGGPALLAGLGNLREITSGPDGSVYLSASASGYVVRRIAPNGVITQVAGGGSSCSATRAPLCPAMNGNALQTWLPWLLSMAVSPDNTLLLGDGDRQAVFRSVKPLPGFDGTDLAVASEDGGELYRFSDDGRHLLTIDAHTGVVHRRFSYDTAGLLVSITDESGNLTSILRESDGRPQAILGPFGQRSVLTVGAAGHLEAVRTPGGETVRFTYDDGGLGLLASRTDAGGAQHQFTYTSTGLLLTDRNPDGLVQSLSSTSSTGSNEVAVLTGTSRRQTYRTETLPIGGYRSVVTNPAGLATTTTVTAGDSVVVVSPDGTSVTTRNSADSRFGTQVPIASTTIRLPSGLIRTMSTKRTSDFATAGDPRSLRLETDSIIDNTSISTTTFDAVARTVTAVTAGGRRVTTRLDSLGREAQVSLGELSQTQFSYDLRGRVDRVTELGRVTAFTYDPQGRLASVINPLGRMNRFAYDSAGRVVASTDAAGIIAFSYDNAGKLQSLAPAGRPAHNFTYTKGGLLSSYEAPALPGLTAATTRYRYNAEQQLHVINRPTGDSIAIAYDAAGRPVAVSHPDAITTFGYSPTTGLLSTVASSEGGRYTYNFDGALLTGTALTGPGISGSVVYAYDSFMRPTAITVNGVSISHGYDADGLLRNAGALVLTRRSATGLTTKASLDEVTTSYGHDSSGILTFASTSVSGTTLYGYALERDALNRITRRVETLDGRTTETRFAYDSAGRLNKVTTDNTLSAAYDYDANGNRLRRTTATGIETGVADARDRLTEYAGATFRYSSAGELQLKIVGPDTTAYHYDALGSLRWVRLPDSRRIDYVIDPSGRRIGKRVNGVLQQRYLYEDDLRIAAELDASEAVVSRFVYGEGINVPEYMERQGKRYRLLTDHLGSVRLVINALTGAVVQRMDYDEFGRVVLNSSPGFQPFGYAGGISDDHSGLVRFGQRDYSPMVGSWTAPDPTRFDGGDANLYRYANSDPLNRIDPNGTFPVLPIIGGVVGAGFRGWKEYLEQCKKWNAHVLRSTLAGFAGGVVSTSVGMLGGPSMGAFFNAAAGAAGGALGSLVTETAAGYTPDPSGVVVSAVLGGALGAISTPASEILSAQGVTSAGVRGALSSTWKGKGKDMKLPANTSKCDECAQ